MEKIIDFSTPDYEEWLRFTFDHVIEEEGLGNNNWIWDEDLDVNASDSAILISHMTRLCNEFAEVVSCYSFPQIDGGIWTLLNEPIRLGEHLANESVAIEDRLRCIASMVRPYADFVAVAQVEVMENCFDMWWDLVVTSYWDKVNWKYNGEEIMALMNDDNYDGSYTPEVSLGELSKDELSILNRMLTTLTQILALDDSRCQQYALHGLGHLQHPQKREIVQNYINESSNDWTKDGLIWLERCRDGTVM